MGNMIVSPSAVKNIDSKVGDPSSASSVSGNDAFSKINTLNSNITNNTAKYLSNNSVYTSIQEAVAPGGTYTCPYDALYMLSCQSDTAGVAAEISVNGGIIANTNTTDSVCTPVYLKAGTVLTMRNRAGQSYRIRGYWR